MMEIKTESSDTSSTTQSPFLIKLPGEVRNNIYRFALIDDASIGFEFKNRKCRRPIVPGVLQTSRQIRNEASRIYYNENKFILYVTILLPHELQNGLNGIIERQSLQLNFWATELGGTCLFDEAMEYIYEIVIIASTIKPHANCGTGHGHEKNSDLVQNAIHRLPEILSSSKLAAAGAGDLYDVLYEVVAQLSGMVI